MGISALYLGSLLLSTPLWLTLSGALLKPFGIELSPSPGPLNNFEAVLGALLLAGLIYAYLQVFKHWADWGGQKSRAQYEQEQARDAASVLRDVILLLNPDPENRKRLTPYRQAVEQQGRVLEKPESLTWHERARQLWLLRHRSYLFEPQAFDPAHHCWPGEEKNTGALALLACFYEAPAGGVLVQAGGVCAPSRRSPGAQPDRLDRGAEDGRPRERQVLPGMYPPVGQRGRASARPGGFQGLLR